MTSKDILNKKFEKAMGGFKADDVQDFLAEVADYVDDILDERAEIENKMVVLAEKLEEYREDEDSLRAALLGAQKLGDSVVKDSKRKAEEILAEAQAKADALVAEATEKAESILNGINDEVEHQQEILHKMEDEVAKFKGKMISLYQANIDILNTIALMPPEPKLETPPEEPPVFLEEEDIPQQAAEKEFILQIEELQEMAEQDVLDVEDKRRKPRFSEPLWFGEEYKLTRKD